MQSAPGFAKDEWPDMAEPNWGAGVSRHYGGEVSQEVIPG